MGTPEALMPARWPFSARCLLLGILRIVETFSRSLATVLGAASGGRLCNLAPGEPSGDVHEGGTC